MMILKGKNGKEKQKAGTEELRRCVYANAKVLRSQSDAKVLREARMRGTQCQGLDKQLSLTAFGALTIQVVFLIWPFVHGEVRTHTLFGAPHVISDLSVRADRLTQHATGIAQTCRQRSDVETRLAP